MNSIHWAPDSRDEVESFYPPRRVGQVISQQIYSFKLVNRDVAVESDIRVVDTRPLDHESEQVVEALADPSWDFRTIDGVASATGLPRDTVRRLIADERFSRRPYGRPSAELFTAKDRRISWRERLSLWSSFVAKRP